MPFRRRSNPGRSWQVHVSANGMRAFKTLPGHLTPREVKDYEARMRLELSLQAKKLPRNVVVLRNPVIFGDEPPEAVVKQLVRQSKRFGVRNILSGMNEDDVRALLRRANGRCEVTGVPLVYAEAVGRKRNPYAPSLDRINCRLGYTVNNCRVAALAVNIALNDWGDAVFHEIATSYAKRPFREARA